MARRRGAVGVRGDGADGGRIFQPVTRGELSKVFGKEVSRDTIGALRGRLHSLRSAQPDAGCTVSDGVDAPAQRHLCARMVVSEPLQGRASTPSLTNEAG